MILGSECRWKHLSTSIYEGVDRECGGTGIRGVEAGVEGAGSGDRGGGIGGGESGKIGREIDFYRKFKDNGP